MISLLTVMKGGIGIETATIGREGAVGALAALGGTNAITRAVVQLTMTATRMSKKRFIDAYNRSEEFRTVIQRSNGALVGQMQQTAACNALHKVEERLARWLLQCQDRVEGNIIDLTQEFLADMLAVRRTSVTSVAKKLQERGLIRYSRGHIEILSRDRLEQQACECYRAIVDQQRDFLGDRKSGA